MVTILRKNKVTQCEVYVRVNGAMVAPPCSQPPLPSVIMAVAGSSVY